MRVEIITPEKKIFSGEATSVSLPGSDGVFQVLNNHAPIISSLKEGEVKLTLENMQESNGSVRKISSNEIGIDISGGIAEFINNKLVVLAN